MSSPPTKFSAARDAVWQAGLTWVRRARMMQRWLNIFLVLGGGLLTVVGGGMEGPLQPVAGTGLLTAKGVCVWLGGALVFLGSILLLILQDEAPAVLQRAKELEGAAQAFLDERDAVLRQLADSEALDRRRLALIDASKAMLEACESGLLAPDIDLDSAIDMMLRAAQQPLMNAIDFERDEYWAVSIFKIDGEEMRRVVALRPAPLEERVEGRSWRKGEGFVGVAWQRRNEVIIADGSAADVAAAYFVPPEKGQPSDATRYKSIAVVPINVGLEDRMWGAVAISSDRAGRFRREPPNRRAQNVDTVRLIALTIELLVAGFGDRNVN